MMIFLPVYFVRIVKILSPVIIEILFITRAAAMKHILIKVHKLFTRECASLNFNECLRYFMHFHDHLLRVEADKGMQLVLQIE